MTTEPTHTIEEAFARGGWHWPEGARPYRVARCHGCTELILWVITRLGRMAPYNRDGISHFATCPVAQSFRRDRAPQRRRTTT